MKGMKSPYKITGAEGVYLYTGGKKLIDSVSSWWSVIHGYNHPEMNEAIISQVRKFSHVMLGGLTHMTLSLEHSYHGDTFRAMEAGDDEDYHFIVTRNI